MENIERFFRKPADSFFLFGPRGTGKSTWLRRQYPDAVYLDLLEPETYRTCLARPERLREIVQGNPRACTVVVDEVQKVPGLLDVVHQLIEQNREPRLQFVLTGSSARKLKRTGVDLLAGRLLLKTLHPFMAAELGPHFDLVRSLRLGMLPLVLAAADPAETLRSYVTLYLREEVQAEGLVRNIENFSRFLEAISFSHGSMLNCAGVARECQVSRKAVEGYVEVLEDLLLGFRVPIFDKRAQRLLVHHSKFYYMDAGVFNSIRPRGPLDVPQEIGGVSLEGLVAQHLRAWIAYGRGESRLYYWRTKSGVEVDFVIYGEEEFLAVEVKGGESVSGRDVRPLITFLEDYPQARACLIYCGRERLEVKGIPCIPCDEFLRNLVPGVSPLRQRA